MYGGFCFVCFHPATVPTRKLMSGDPAHFQTVQNIAIETRRTDRDSQALLYRRSRRRFGEPGNGRTSAALKRLSFSLHHLGYNHNLAHLFRFSLPLTNIGCPPSFLPSSMRSILFPLLPMPYHVLGSDATVLQSTLIPNIRIYLLLKPSISSPCTPPLPSPARARCPAPFNFWDMIRLGKSLWWHLRASDPARGNLPVRTAVSMFSHLAPWRMLVREKTNVLRPASASKHSTQHLIQVVCGTELVLVNFEGCPRRAAV